MAAVTPETLHAFHQHLPACHCPSSNGGRVNPHVFYGAKRFVRYLCALGVLPGAERAAGAAPEAPLLTGFRHWLQRHRGVAESTLKLYCWGVREFLQTLGHDPSHYTVHNIRAFFLAYAQRSQTTSAKKLATAVRAFLRYLSVQGHCQTGLDGAIPALAGWRLASLPRCLTATEVERLLAVCAGASLRAKRDRAILLLLARLGLRAGDVANLQLSDIDWAEGSLRVAGKGRYEVRLPLPQDVGEAVLHYLDSRPQVGVAQVFVSVFAPCRPFRSGDAVSSVVARAMQRAGVEAPSHGAHILRHTAATEMLRHGASLADIGAVLRHRTLDTTAYYAKVDVRLLTQVAQPWPEGLP